MEEFKSGGMQCNPTQGVRFSTVEIVTNHRAIKRLHRHTNLVSPSRFNGDVDQ